MSKRVRLFGLLVVWTLLAAACSSASDSQVTTTATTLPAGPAVETTIENAAASGEVRVGEGAPVEVAAGPGIIQVPSTAVSGPGVLKVEPATGSGPEGVELVGSAFDVSLEGTDLLGSVEFSMPAPVPPPDFPEGVPSAWLATFDGATKTWTPIETVLMDGRLVAEVDHFSIFAWMQPDLDWLVDTFNGMIESVLGPGVMGVEHPTCAGEDAARAAGIDVASDDGSTTMWCVGVEDGQTVLKVTNNRRYSVGMDTPDGFEVLHRDADSGTVELLTQVSESALGFDVTLSRGETVVFGIPDGGSGLVVVKPSPGTFLLEVLSLEADFAVTVLAPKGKATAAIVAKCVGDNATDLFGDDLQGNVSAAFIYGFGCLSDGWVLFFPSGWMVELIWGFLSTTVRLVVEGLAGSIAGVIDSVTGIFDGSDIYRINIVQEQSAVEVSNAWIGADQVLHTVVDGEELVLDTFDGWEVFGPEVLGGRDFDGDGVQEIMISYAPGSKLALQIVSVLDSTLTVVFDEAAGGSVMWDSGVECTDSPAGTLLRAWEAFPGNDDEGWIFTEYTYRVDGLSLIDVSNSDWTVPFDGDPYDDYSTPEHEAFRRNDCSPASHFDGQPEPSGFPVWRIPSHGETSSVVYVTVVSFDAPDWEARIANGHARLAEIGLDLWAGWGGASCDVDEDFEQAYDGPDGATVGVYFDTTDEAHRFAAAWEDYFGEPPIAVIDEVRTFCLD